MTLRKDAESGTSGLANFSLSLRVLFGTAIKALLGKESPDKKTFKLVAISTLVVAIVAAISFALFVLPLW